MCAEIFASRTLLPLLGDLFPFRATVPSSTGWRPAERSRHVTSGTSGRRSAFRQRSRAARSTAAFVVLIPSATIFMELTISSSLRPRASSMPTVRFRLRSPVHVRTRSPKPASPARVCALPPMATARRVISASPRVMSAAMALCPSPIPCNTPAPMATTFLMEPPISTPIGSGLVYTRKVGPEKAACRVSAKPGSVEAATTAVGSKRATSRANEGPEMTATRDVPTTSRITSVTRMREWFSRPFRGTDEHHAFIKVRQHPLVQAAGQVRRHDAEHDFRAIQGFGKIGSDNYICRYWAIRQVNVVDSRGGHARRQIGFENPKLHPGKTRSKYDGEGGAPAASADNRQILQNLNTFSVPSRSRWILLLCL